MSVQSQSGPAAAWLRQGSQRFRAEGRAALDRLSVGAQVVADPPERFRLAVDRVDLGEVALERIRLTPFDLVGMPETVPGPQQLSVCFVARGRLRFRRPGMMTVAAGDSWVAIDGDSIAFGADEPVEVLRVSTGATRFASAQLAACGLPRITPARTRVTDGLFGLVRGILTTPTAPAPAKDGGTHLVRAISTLVAAVVDDLAGGGVARSDDDIDRARAIEYIDQHMADPTTSPDTVAAALHIGRRRLYRLFEADDLSIAARIRRSRVDGVAALVDSVPATPSVTALAQQFGFSSTDALTRSFRERFGMTVREYHQRVRRRR